ncbi:HalOD1 output domain-containing protein [Haloarcula litorea]|uniref:HalOD1 output domain-containing protein n=1 Tax=Haloarcula litorea TaxID=3032579 RepID=UPI0023E877D1|nr:HalOD1 output domain-containing protein [Halomicroarcula sp. GDY20]
MSEDHDPTVVLARAIAEVEGTSPHALGYSLGEYVDTDAVRQLLAMDNVDWTLTVTVHDHEVAIDGDGRVTVDGTVVRRLEDSLVEES